MRLEREKSPCHETGFGLGRPLGKTGPLSDIGNLPGGGILAQKGNSCGTCSLSAVMRHFGVESTQREIDREIRNANIFSAVDLLVRYAGKRGFEAAFRNEGSVGEVTDLVDREIPVLLLVDTRPGPVHRPLHLHYVVAISHRKTRDGEFRLGVYNPWGLREEITAEELDRAWSNVHVGPFDCWNRAYVAVTRSGVDLDGPRPTGARGVNMIALGLANAVNGFVHLVRDASVARALVELVSAPPELLAGLSLFVAERSGVSGGRPR